MEVGTSPSNRGRALAVPSSRACRSDPSSVAAEGGRLPVTYAVAFTRENRRGRNACREQPPHSL